MISIARKNFSCLVSNPNSFLCNFNGHFFPSIHCFSTSRIKRKLIPSPEIFDVLVNKHQFSPELASLASSHLPQFRSPKRADSVLSFLKENSFMTTQLERIVIYDPRILGFTIEGLKFKFKVFQDLGLSSEEIAKMMVLNTKILHSSMSNGIIPKLSILKGLLGSNQEVARLLIKSSWFVTHDLEKTLMPNVEILKSSRIPMDRILHFLYIEPRSLLIKPHIMKKSVDKAIEVGVSLSSCNFIRAVCVCAFMSKVMWEVKLQTFRDLGFSDNDTFAIFRNHPKVLTTSEKKMKNVIVILLGTGKYNISNIVANPSSIGCSIEKRLEPRLQVLGLLESRNLIEKWPGLSTMCKSTDDKFFDVFIRPYFDEIGEEHIIKEYVEGKKISET